MNKPTALVKRDRTGQFLTGSQTGVGGLVLGKSGHITTIYIFSLFAATVVDHSWLPIFLFL